MTNVDVQRQHLRPGVDFRGLSFRYQVMLGFGKPFRVSQKAT